MRGYHIRIRVTVWPASTKTPAKSAAWAADTFVPKSIFEILPSHTPKKTSRKNAILGSKRRDYRYGPIRIDWLDLESSPQQPSSAKKPIEESKDGIERRTMDSTLTTSGNGNGKERDNRSGGPAKRFHFAVSRTDAPLRRSNCSQVRAETGPNERHRRQPRPTSWIHESS
jgi:hypothetical protein